MLCRVPPALPVRAGTDPLPCGRPVPGTAPASRT